MKGTKSAAQPGGAKKSYVKRELEDPTRTYITSIIIAFSHTTDDDTAGGGTGGVDKLVIANVDAHMTDGRAARVLGEDPHVAGLEFTLGNLVVAAVPLRGGGAGDRDAQGFAQVVDKAGALKA